MQVVVGCLAGTPERVAADIRDHELQRGVFSGIRLYPLPDGKVFVLIIEDSMEVEDAGTTGV
jgi:alkanesulfonate monooxygenase SsuD/methylene tetrahydromethanopterin reductase-like flavin-dependent oxidoreductase (luciferase family)